LCHVPYSNEMEFICQCCLTISYRQSIPRDIGLRFSGKERIEANRARDLVKGYIRLLRTPGSLTEIGVTLEEWELLSKEYK
jgi:hypothetical protein